MEAKGVAGDGVSRRDAMKTALKASAYTAPVVLGVTSVSTRVAAVTPPPPGGPSFAAAVSIATAAKPKDFVFRDFNNDGIPDIAVANDGGTVSIFIGNGNGTFKPRVDIPLPTTPDSTIPFAIVAGDFNGDGNQDLVVLSTAKNLFTFLPGKGDGTFLPGTNSGVGPGTNALVAGDWNADGKLDLAVTSAADNTVKIYLGNGAGAFTLGPSYPTGILPVALVVGNFGGPFEEDLAAANESGNSVSVLIDNGNGTFQPALTFPTGTGPAALASGKFVILGGIDPGDLVTADLLGGTGSVLLGLGTGSFGAPFRIPLGGTPIAVTTGFLSGTPNLDFVVADFSGNRVDVVPGNGDGTFQSAVFFPVGKDPIHVGVADFNCDGKGDIATLNSFDNTMSVLLNTNPSPTRTPFPVSVFPPGILNQAGQHLTIRGSGFAPLSLVFIGGQICTNTVVSPNGKTITCDTSKGMLDGFSDVLVVAPNFARGILKDGIAVQ